MLNHLHQTHSLPLQRIFSKANRGYFSWGASCELQGYRLIYAKAVSGRYDIIKIPVLCLGRSMADIFNHEVEKSFLTSGGGAPEICLKVKKWPRRFLLSFIFEQILFSLCVFID